MPNLGHPDHIMPSQITIRPFAKLHTVRPRRAASSLLETGVTRNTKGIVTAPMRPDGQPLTFTVNPRLDAALLQGWEAWEDAARIEGVEETARWLAHRIGQPRLKEDLIDSVHTLLLSANEEERALARAEIAELADEPDPMLADTLWEGVLEAGYHLDDPDIIFAATTHLAAIAEAQGDPLAAAEYYINFLNWRRADEHTSDAEHVQTAFDEIIRLARLDGDQRAAALYEFRQAQFTRLEEAEDDRVTVGDWETDPRPYESWA
jgi:hypothetical protein